MDGRAGTDCGDGGLLLGVFEDEPDDGVDVSDCDVEFVVWLKWSKLSNSWCGE